MFRKSKEAPVFSLFTGIQILLQICPKKDIKLYNLLVQMFSQLLIRLWSILYLSIVFPELRENSVHLGERNFLLDSYLCFCSFNSTLHNMYSKQIFFSSILAFLLAYIGLQLSMLFLLTREIKQNCYWHNWLNCSDF